MDRQTIKKEILIDAPRQKVWDVLIDDRFTRQWYACFSEGSHADTDWKQGSKAIFTDNSKRGMIARVITNKPNEEIAIMFDGIITDGKEDYESNEAQQVKGGIESYHLSAVNGSTRLSISCDMPMAYVEMMSQQWDKALEQVKQLAEAQVSVSHDHWL